MSFTLLPSPKITTSFFLVSCVFLFASCVATIQPTTHYLAINQKEGLPVTVTRPVNWQIIPDKERGAVTLVSNTSKERATITAKALAAEKLNSKLLEVFGRIHVAKTIEQGWKEQNFTDKLLFDGHQAVRYVLEKGEQAAIIYYIGKDQFVYIVTITAPKTTSSTTDAMLVHNIKISSQELVVKSAEVQDKILSEPASPHIANLVISKLDAARVEYEKERTTPLTMPERIKLMEQICFRLALYKSESLYHDIDDDARRIFKDIRLSYHENGKNRNLARCGALISYLENSYQESIKQFEEILFNNPGDTHSKLYLAMIRPYHTAFNRKILSQILETEKENTLAQFLRSKLLRAEGKEKESISLLEESLKKDRKSVWLNYSVARQYQLDSKVKEAKSLYSTTIRLYPEFIPAMYNLALIRYQEKNFKAAQQLLDGILAEQSNNVDALLLQGLLHQKTMEFQEAKNIFETVMAIDPDNYQVIYNIGVLCADKLRDSDCARMAFDRYIKIAPTENRYSSIMNWLNNN